MYVSAEDIIKAMEENGYKWKRGGWFETTYRRNPNSYESYDKVFIGGCIMGQAALNLNMDSGQLTSILERVKYDLSSQIIEWNDDRKDLTYNDILRNIKNSLVFIPKEALTKKYRVKKVVRKTEKLSAGQTLG